MTLANALRPFCQFDSQRSFLKFIIVKMQMDCFDMHKILCKLSIELEIFWLRHALNKLNSILLRICFTTQKKFEFTSRVSRLNFVTCVSA